MVVVFQVGGGPGAGGGGSAPSEAPGWPAMQSPHWPTAPAVAAAVTGVPTATPTPIAAHPDYGAYHQVSVDHLNQTKLYKISEIKIKIFVVGKSFVLDFVQNFNKIGKKWFSLIERN